MKATWYYRGGNKLNELWTILHLPYTGMLLSYCVIGAAMVPKPSFFRLFWTLVAYFFGLGIAAHCLDQLPGMGSRYVKHLTGGELKALSVISLGVAVAIGVYGTTIVGPILWIFILLGGFFAVAYPVSRSFGGLFHNDFWFAVSWGALPFLTSYYAQALTITLEAALMSVAIALTAAMEIILSRHVRGIRAGPPEHAQFLVKPERVLKILVAAVILLALAMFVWSLPRFTEPYIFR